MANRILRPDQAAAIEELRQEIGQGERRIVLQAPCGYGKTVLAGEIADRALAKNKRVLFTVPAVELVNQAVESFREAGVWRVGVIQAKHEMTNWDMPVQVASIQSLMRRTIPPSDIVMIDECHQFWHKFYPRWFLDPTWKNIPIIGLSATPWTKGLGAYFHRLIIAGTTEQMIEAGNLSPFRVFAPAHPDLTGVRTLAGDYHEGDLSTTMSDSVLTADIVETWLKRGENRPTFLFCVDRAHAKAMQQLFEAAGVPTAYMDALTPRAERDEIREGFHAGKYKVVANVGVLIVGIDWDVRCLVIARPTKSEMLHCQMIGRALRIAPGKENALLLDHSDNHLRLGFVTDIHHDTLHDGKTNEKDPSGNIPLPKECPQCHFLRPPRTKVCPNCGHVSQAPNGKVETADGELHEFVRPKKHGKDTWDKAETYAMLKGFAEEKGYNPGWAKHKFKTIFDVWPNHYESLPVIEPSPKIRSWIKSQQIAWAKSKHNEANQRQPRLPVEDDPPRQMEERRLMSADDERFIAEGGF